MIRKLDIKHILVFLLLVMFLSVYIFKPAANVSAQELSDRGITMSTANPGVAADYKISFKYTSLTPIGSVLIEFCQSPIDGVPCVAPPGIDTSNASFSGQTGETGFSVMTLTGNTILLTRNPVGITNPSSSYTFTGITNPDFNSCTNAVVPDCTFYGRIYTYGSTDGSGPNVDFGGLAASTNPSLTISTIVPPILSFCVGQIITGTDCTTATGDIVNLGIMSPYIASGGTSQMVAATNAEFGLAIAADGTTMTSGNLYIPNLTIPTVSAPGNSQFGFNLVSNSDPMLGQNPNGPGVANPTPSYDIPNEYLFNPGDVVATSPDVTDFRKFTVSYVANVTPAQQPGLYTSTITYVCTATF